jgi:hypothetical protein
MVQTLHCREKNCNAMQRLTLKALPVWILRNCFTVTMLQYFYRLLKMTALVFILSLITLLFHEILD